MELRVFVRRPPSLRCCLGILMLALPVAPPSSGFRSQRLGRVRVSAESACQPEFLLVGWIGLELDPDHAPSISWPRLPPNWLHPLTASFPCCTLAPPLHCSLHPKDKPRPLLPFFEPLSLAPTILHLWPRPCIYWPRLSNSRSPPQVQPAPGLGRGGG